VNKGEIQIYKSSQGTEIQVKLYNETIWLDAHLIALLFNVKRPAVVKHIQNIYKSKELAEKATCSILEQVAGDGKKRKMNLYNLDMIISVGYRVNSKQATQFRQWATQRLKDYLVKGYAVNQQRLDQLNQIVNVIQKSSKIDLLHIDEAKGLLEILSNYTRSFVFLNQYDTNTFKTEKFNTHLTYEIKYLEAKIAIQELKKKLIAKKEASQLFGNEKDKSFEGTLKSVAQIFNDEYLYPTIEEQAAHLMYFIIKNHPFSDGNKRIGAFLFIWFLEKNKHHFKKSGEIKINDNALTALTLLVAQSNPNEKETMTSLICNLISSE